MRIMPLEKYTNIQNMKFIMHILHIIHVRVLHKSLARKIC